MLDCDIHSLIYGFSLKKASGLIGPYIIWSAHEFVMIQLAFYYLTGLLLNFVLNILIMRLTDTSSSKVLPHGRGDKGE
jgi:hypothetical protein